MRVHNRARPMLADRQVADIQSVRSRRASWTLGPAEKSLSGDQPADVWSALQFASTRMNAHFPVCILLVERKLSMNRVLVAGRTI